MEWLKFKTRRLQQSSFFKVWINAIIYCKIIRLMPRIFTEARFEEGCRCHGNPSRYDVATLPHSSGKTTSENRAPVTIISKILNDAETAAKNVTNPTITRETFKDKLEFARKWPSIGRESRQRDRSKGDTSRWLAEDLWENPWKNGKLQPQPTNAAAMTNTLIKTTSKGTRK